MQNIPSTSALLRTMLSLNEITLDPLSPLEVDILCGLVTGELGPCLERLYVGTVEDDHELTLHMIKQRRNRHAQSRWAKQDTAFTHRIFAALILKVTRFVPGRAPTGSISGRSISKSRQP